MTAALQRGATLAGRCAELGPLYLMINAWSMWWEFCNTYAQLSAALEKLQPKALCVLPELQVRCGRNHHVACSSKPLGGPAWDVLC